MNWALFEQVDSARRLQGALLDVAGIGPVETPYGVAHSEPGVALRRYEGGEQNGLTVLIVPAPIKRPYIWDLAPEISVVRRCLDAGARVFLADWQAAPPHFGLDDYADRLIVACLEAAGGGAAILLGHSLGGLFTAIFAALHPERARGVALFAAPLHFGPHTHAFNTMVAGLAAQDLPERLPGSFLSMASFNAAPKSFGWERWMDGALSLGDPSGLRTHLQVQRWTLDEFALPRRLVGELAALIVREDRFARGLLEINGRGAAPSQLAAPLLCVLDPLCTLVPTTAVLPVFEAVSSRDKTLLDYERDVGVALQHVGPLVSRRAHESLWPGIVRWIETH
jgi:polyhydroxyalkanoate synthase subunit PhaC